MIPSVDGSWFMVLNTTFNNISVIMWQLVLLVEETRVPRELIGQVVVNPITIRSHQMIPVERVALQKDEQKVPSRDDHRRMNKYLKNCL
jgi:hypothetical protein